MSPAGLLLLPLLIGLILAITWQSGLFHNPVLFVRIDLGSLLLTLGATTSLISVAVALLRSHDRRQTELSLQRANQVRAETHRRFIGRLNHEIKNPLTAIRAGLANADSRHNAAALASVHTQVDRLARLSADLRKLADLETVPLEMERVDLCRLLDELMDTARERPDAPYYHLRLNLPQAPWPVPPIVGDRDLIFLALHNLVDNAMKFSGHGATVEIRAFEDGSMDAVEIADTGPGISDEDLPHLGEELYRGQTAMGVEGSGLGLALVRAIVERHGGTVNIRSRVRQGTVVALRFPIAH